jgi:hypothetical protein
VLEAGSDTKFLTISANPTFWTHFGSHKELGGALGTIIGKKTIFAMQIPIEKKIKLGLLSEREEGSLNFTPPNEPYGTSPSSSG